MIASVMASVSGSVIRKVVPWPGRDSTVSRPPRPSTVSRTTAMPTPRPLARSASSRVENPDEQMMSSSARESSPSSVVTRPSAVARCVTDATSMPRPSSAISMITVSPAVAAPRRIVPSGRLARCDARIRRLDAVTDRVAHQMQHRIHHSLDQELVDLGALPGELEVYALAVVARQIADDKGHATEDLADRYEAHAHHAFTQIAKVALETSAVVLHRPPFLERHIRFDAPQRVFEP